MINMTDQDPAAMSEQVQNATRYSLGLRYQIIPHLYTLFYYATINGDTVMRPLFFEWPYDKYAQTIDEQFLLGPSLMVIPALWENQTTVKAYFPPGRWYGDDGEIIAESDLGVNKTLDMPLM